MNLFVNAISRNAKLILFDDNKNIIQQVDFEIKWNESSLLLPKIDQFLKSNNLSYNDIKNIAVVNWPGSFTWARTIVLVINTIAFLTNCNITPLNYFDLFNSYPIIKSSSKRDSFFKNTHNSDIIIIENNKLEELLKKKQIESIFWEWDIKNIKIIEKIDYYNIIKWIKLKDFKQISPLYIKKPNIS